MCIFNLNEHNGSYLDYFLCIYIKEYIWKIRRIHQKKKEGL